MKPGGGVGGVLFMRNVEHELFKFYLQAESMLYTLFHFFMYACLFLRWNVRTIKNYTT